MKKILAILIITLLTITLTERTKKRLKLTMPKRVRPTKTMKKP